jgi:hypothetical protein
MARVTILLARCLVRYQSTATEEARKSLLRRIYEPFKKLEKGTPEFEVLAHSENFWEDYYRLSDSRHLEYVDLQRVSHT